MARKKDHDPKIKWHHALSPETKQSIWAIFSFAMALVFILVAMNKAGFLGKELNAFLTILFGKALFLVPVLFVLIGCALIFSFRQHIVAPTIVGGVLFLLSALGVADLVFGDKAGGYVGFVISYPAQKMLDFWAALIMLAAMLIISLLIVLNVPLKLNFRKSSGGEDWDDGEPAVQPYIKEEPAEQKKTKPEPERPGGGKAPEAEEKNVVGGWLPSGFSKDRHAVKGGVLQAIPLDLLERDRGKPLSGDIKGNSNIIKRTLQNFGIEVEMGEVSIGPSVTQYTLRPAEGIKLSKILALQNDLSLALAVHPIRIEAPIPGRPLVGIEIPNKAISTVGLKDLLSAEEFRDSPSPLLFAVGRSVAGQTKYANLAAMPHLLIAGSTGSGKSVCIHSILMSLLYRNYSHQLKLLMIDPKRVEMTVYDGIPHLLTPVITEAKKAILALKWATQEMERRYDVLSKAKVRDIGSYHVKIANDEEADAMPFIVIVIDELADLMATYPRELESAVVRLAQMSRAVGIHLLVSTQRPSVEVITGLIKANITSRVAFQVASQVDSRTILDMAGAEKLLGNGDMLFLSGDVSKPVRIQGAFVSEKEIKRVVQFILEEYGNAEAGESVINLNKVGAESSIFDSMSVEDVDDDLYEEARQIVIEAGRASTSYLQRRLKVGYARAARLMDMLEERGIVGPADGAKPRDVLIREARSDESGYNDPSLV